MEIRPPQKPNYPPIAGLLEAAFGRPWDLEALVNAVMADERYDPNLVLVAREKGETLGFLHSVIEDSTAWIKLIAVHPSRRGQGLGREMLERLEERAFGEGARHAVAGFSTPPLFKPGVPESAAGFFLKLGYAARPQGCMGRLKAPQGAKAGTTDKHAASILVKRRNPSWWGWAEEQMSFPDPRIRCSADGRAACFWEPGKIGPLLEDEAGDASLREAASAAALAAGGGELEFQDSRLESWWRERFEVSQGAACVEMSKDLSGVFHA